MLKNIQVKKTNKNKKKKKKKQQQKTMVAGTQELFINHIMATY